MFATTFFVSAATLAADSTVESRLAALETRLASLETENAHLRTRLGKHSPAMRPDAPSASVGPKVKALKVSGYSQIHAEFGGAPDERRQGTDARIFIRRDDIALRGDLGHDFSFTLEAELSSGSSGEKSGHTPRLTDAYVAWALAEDFKVQIGQFKSPFGRAQLGSNTKFPLIERPLASDRLTVGRQVGVALMGQVGESIPLAFNIGIFNGTGANKSFTVNSQFMTAGRVVAQLWQQNQNNWEVAANAFHYDPSQVGSAQRVGWGLDTRIKLGAFTTEAEYLRSEYDEPGSPEYRAEGWWISTQWQGVVHYGVYDSFTNLPGDASLLLTLGVHYLLSGDDIKLSLNYLHGDASLGIGDRLLGRLQVKF
ncbi:MAG: carbohydrate porin [Candidatus Synoicihabitans palmerolidicus]|nr:carbohydrate porin [Candidatus Synoicihabitans palmerolidicus]